MSHVNQLAAVLDQLELPYGRDGNAFSLQLPGERKQSTQANLIVEDHALKIVAFVARCPEENHQQVWEELLRRNGRLFTVAFAIDNNADIYLIGRAPLIDITSDEIDRILGVVLETADGMFNHILELGFASSIRDEWRWRLDRGEPTGNLAAFTHLKPRD